MRACKRTQTLGGGAGFPPKGRGRAWRTRKTPLSNTWCRTKFRHSGWNSLGVTTNFSDGWAPPPLDGGGGWLTPRNAPLHLALSYQILSLYDMGPKSFGDAGAPPPWDVDVADPLEICFSHLCYLAKFGHSKSHRTGIIMEICQIMWPLTPAFRGHSRSLEPSRIDRLPMTSYYCSIVTIALFRIVSKIKWWYLRNCLFPLYLTHPMTGYLGLLYRRWDIKILEWCAYQNVKNVYSFSRNTGIEQTERRTEWLKQYRAPHALHADARIKKFSKSEKKWRNPV